MIVTVNVYNKYISLVPWNQLYINSSVSAAFKCSVHRFWKEHFTGDFYIIIGT